MLMLLELGTGALMVAAYRWSGEASAGLGSAPFVVTAVSAAVGIGVLLVILAANLSTARAVRAGRPSAGARGLALLGQWLAVGRLLLLVGSVVLVWIAQGGEAGDLADYGLLCFAAIAALFTVFLAMATGRGARA
ncbi:hypothetical protein AB0J86_04935 [Micromonospora sp. NPDC049559]|uniref:hypothetical protein n=1 Tax=Micromonospora sp. NPDC049559 TaxID=3155923 RepID=UPI003445059A